MKVRLWSELLDEKIGTSELKGRGLVTMQDPAGFLCYEIRFPAESKSLLQSPYGNEWNHVYYILKAEHLIFQCDNGTKFETKTDSVVAMTGNISAHLTVKGASCRLFVIYVPKTAEDSQPSSVIHRSLDELIGTDRDIDWQHGRSRRFLRKDDGFNISIHNTINIPGSVSPIHYKNQFEAVYWVGGRGQFTWGGNKCDQYTRDWDCSTDEKQNDPTMMVVGNTSHIVHSYEPGPVSLAVFYPPLKGTETHDFASGGKASSY